MALRLPRKRFVLPFLLNGLLAVGTVGVVAHVFLNAPQDRNAGGERSLETRLASEGKQAFRLRTRPGPRRPSVSIRFDRPLLASYSLLLRHATGEDSIFIDGNGEVFRDGKRIGTVERGGTLTETASERALLLDGVVVARDLADWEALWVTGEASPPRPEVSAAPVVRFEDHFMRRELINADWTLSAGNAELFRHGGGMPSNERQKRNPNFQRAVNPFTVRAEHAACVTTGDQGWRQCHLEARFYFGKPREGDVIDRDTLPLRTNMLVAQGPVQGRQVAFGWRGRSARFVLVARDGVAGPWRVLATVRGLRPPLTNWVKIGLETTAGGRVAGYLDGRKVLETVLDYELAGPMHVVSGRGMIEFDDVAAWSVPRGEDEQTPYFIKSRNFTGKKRKHDSDRYRQWTESRQFFERIERREAGTTQKFLVTTKPLMGAFRYESVPEDEEAGTIPDGRYAFTFVPKAAGALPEPDAEPTPERTVHALRKNGLWHLLREDGSLDPDLPALFAIRFARGAGPDATLDLVGAEQAVPLFPLPENQVHLGIARVYPGESGDFPRPEHHRITCANLSNELFEEAPTDWSWIHGAFRMDMRWACQDQWNFMACGSPATPLMVSKRRFAGDQEHEFYMSLRPMMPWDAGDTTWTYDPDADRRNGYKILHKHNGWYIRHDFNFSFCCDGRNPLSGYALIFAGEDNQRTMLLRRGEVVAETTAAEHLFSTEESHLAVHWKWWAFRIRKYGPHIRVFYNAELILEYDDPAPLSGGHVAYWTVRNGFTVARSVSISAASDAVPQVLYVPYDEGTEWRALRRDAVHLEDVGGRRTRVTANAGAGHFGARYTFDSAVDLEETPILNLPFELSANARVNLFVETDEHSAILAFTAPLAGMKALLTPPNEQGECFDLDVLDPETIEKKHLLARVALREGTVEMNLLEALRSLDVENPGTHVQSLTFGNASNQDYLKAGKGGNTAGTWYEVGVPRFVADSGDKAYALKGE